MAGGELHDSVTRRLRAGGQRYTAARRRLVEVLARAGRPLNIPQVLEQAPGLAQSSTYRNLTVLEQAGVVERIITADDRARFELAEDLTDEHHHHLICSACGDVADFTVPTAVETALARALRQVSRTRGFTPAHHRLDLVGVCAACS